MAIWWPINLLCVYKLHLHFMCILQMYYPINLPVAMAAGNTVNGQNRHKDWYRLGTFQPWPCQLRRPSPWLMKAFEVKTSWACTNPGCIHGSFDLLMFIHNIYLQAVALEIDSIKKELLVTVNTKYI